MDMKKLCDMLTSNEDLKDIPIIYVFRVAFAIFEAINSGEYYLTDGDLYEMDIL